MQMMDNAVEARIENSIETRKDWSAPELQKIDIEQITAAMWVLLLMARLVAR
jgi:hypothetical protein